MSWLGAIFKLFHIAVYCDVFIFQVVIKCVVFIIQVAVNCDVFIFQVAVNGNMFTVQVAVNCNVFILFLQLEESGKAHENDKLRVGDYVLEVNEIRCATVKEAQQLIESAFRTLTLKIWR